MGWAVGAPVGSELGVAVVGAPVGAELGRAVGTAEGDAVATHCCEPSSA